ncbi:polysaccharide deacetylase family protein [Latilactobacillus sakei]|uniref:polysaccharide deacetylase family protein n=1 Tax=Latilactobacillus sakei TaxID=1599 RepID=UPI000976710C|nr:polysaccharide deacetylase family protein [Latilactobacillus sakei]
MRTWQKTIIIILTLIAIPIIYFENQYFSHQQKEAQIKTSQKAVFKAYRIHSENNYANFAIYTDTKSAGKIYYFVPKNQQGHAIDLRRQQQRIGEQLYQKARKQKQKDIVVYITYNGDNLHDDTYCLTPTGAVYSRVEHHFSTKFGKFTDRLGQEAVYNLANQTHPVTFKDLYQDAATLPMIKQLAVDQQLKKYNYTPHQLKTLENLDFPTDVNYQQFSFSQHGLTLNFSKNTLGIKQITLPLATIGPYLNPDYIAEGYTMPSAKKKSKSVALTFNTALDTDSAKQVLEILNEKAAQATFFPTGEAAHKHPKTLKKISAANQAIGNQSYAADDAIDTMSEADLSANLAKTDQAIFKATGALPRFMRVTPDTTNKAIASASQRALISWSVDSEDWRTDIKATDITKNVIERTTGGDVILLRTAPETIKALPALIDQLQAKGYHLATIPSLFEHRLAPFQQYAKAADPYQD